ncbi:MAG TPA: hypothetical protein VGE51_07970 [Fontimonas sp.]
MNQQMQHLVLEALEHERGGIDIYRLAVETVRDADLKKEFSSYLQQTRQHERLLLTVCEDLGLDPEAETPGRPIVRDNARALADAIMKARKTGNADLAELVACETVVLAETKDHANWELLNQVAQALRGSERESLQSAVDEIDDEEDEHLSHSKGWCHELWMKSLGLRAVRPTEKRRHVTTATGARV